MADHLEVEETFEAPAGGDLPVLSGLPGVVAVTGPEQVELEATYFDTAGLDLVGAGITLNSRAAPVRSALRSWRSSRRSCAAGRR